ncbi:phage baseplate assembly protein, partial [Pseudomonas shahriarae]|uniref:phage baseplate assembly protein n=1 Tax=Pseudomonas shahriarae TaxID=2745512 RepID=UPI00236047BE
MSLLNRMLVRGTVVLVDSARKLQALQMRLTAGEVKDGLEHFEPYGFTSNPLAGAEGIAAFIGGDRPPGGVVGGAGSPGPGQGKGAGGGGHHTPQGGQKQRQAA